MWRTKETFAGEKKRGKDMGLRFRKSIKIAPGLKINLNKKQCKRYHWNEGRSLHSELKREKDSYLPNTRNWNFLCKNSRRL